MDQKNQTKGQKLTRRGFIAGAGSFLGGAALMAGGYSLSEAKTPPEANKVVWPAPYAQLDPEDVRVRGYVSYYKYA